MAEGDVQPPRTERRDSGQQQSWASSHKGILIGGALVAAVAVYFFFIRKKSAPSNTVTPQGAATLTYPSSGTTGYTGARLYSALSQQQALSNQTFSAQVSSLHTTFAKLLDSLHSQNNPGRTTKPATNQGSSTTYGRPPTSVTPVTLANATPQGYGFSYGTYKMGSFTGYTGSKYNTISSYTATLTDFKKGLPVYIQTSPGTFSEVTKTQFVALEPAAHGGPGSTTTYLKG